MHLSIVEKNIIALHYYFPAPMNRYRALLRVDPELQHISSMPTSQLATLLNLPFDKAHHLKLCLEEYTVNQLCDMYTAEQIIPIPFMHPHYPKQLQELIDPPTVLYAQGDIQLLKRMRKVAIIGARRATVYSEKALSYIIPPLVQEEVVVVSGLAKGADRMAHEGAIRYGGATIAVLGHGFSHLYPKEHRQLKEQLVKSHLVITEYPPYVRPAKWTFPMRNRIISGLSDAIIVTESKRKSGTMSTIDHGLDHGKEIFAVPGPIHSTLSEGPNFLIHEGATPITNGFQVVKFYEEKLKR